jgi:pimeloyl-ACP methyl ester carboxylesterase
MGVRRVVTMVGVAIAAAVIWVAITTFFLWRNQERVVFQPPSIGAPDPQGVRRVEVRAPDGNVGFALVVAPANSRPKPTVVLVFHGNADLAVWQVPWAQELSHRTGATVVLAEFRGYAGIPGTPTYATAADDARGALAYARTLSPGRLVLFGHSLGSAIATELASEMAKEPPAALVLQSPFTSARDMAARMMAPLISAFWNRITRVHYDTRARVQQLDVPVWVAHGSIDLTIPSRMGRDVSAASQRKGEFLLVQGAGHNDVAEVGGEEYWKWIATAVSGLGGGAASAAVGEPEKKGGGRLP